jgi:hypothetical protein
LFFGACETTKKIHKPPADMKQAFAEMLPPQKISINKNPKKNDVPLIREDFTFTEIIIKEGIPTENIIPRKKEQITIYKKREKYLVYYFIENKLYSKKDYTEQDMNKLRVNSEYPKNLYKELGVFK